MPSVFPSKELVKWFEKNQRPLPWRKDYNPYHVWISEIMAQQTRIDQMLPYYDRFLKKFSTVKILADAPPQDVLKMWEGLGYYSRARNLHEAAKHVMKNYGGEIPPSKEKLQALKGFGPYISSAVASIAFNENVPVVDGNVLRVVTRYWGILEDVSLPKTRLSIETKLRENFPNGSARAFNQGIMELGALVCTPDSPSCGECPLKKGCFAFAHSRQDDFPVKAKKKKSSTKHFAMLVLEKDGKYGLVQRTTQLLHGMWEFPMVEYHPLTDSAETIEKKFQKEGFEVKVGKGLHSVSHQYSHFNQEVSLFIPRSYSNLPIEWVSIAQLQARPLSKVQRKVLDFLRERESL